MRRKLFGLAATVVLSACQWEGTWGVPEMSLERMLEQPRYDSYERSDFFDDSRVMRTPPEGTVPYSEDPRDPRVEAGDVSGTYVESIPIGVDLVLIREGRRRFNVTCAVCHGIDGYSDTPVAREMSLRKPPSLHSHEATTMPAGRLYEIITIGHGLMPSYRAQLDTEARWAVVAYVRALQLSQHARVQKLPKDIVAELLRRAP